MGRTVTDILVEALVAEGVSTVFALMGDGNLDLVSALESTESVEVIHGCHEQGVVAMADGYARFSGLPGVATVTHGPGITNTGTSLVTAVKAGSPLVLLAPATPPTDLEHPQAFAQQTFLESTGAHIVQLHGAAGASAQLSEVFTHSRAGFGPAVFHASTDLLLGPAAPDDSYVLASPSTLASAPTPEQLRDAADLLIDTARPSILIGRGAISEDAADAISELSLVLGAPIITTLKGKGALRAHPHRLGVAGGLGDVAATTALAASDCVLILGASANQWTSDEGNAFTDGRVIRVDIDERALSANVDADVEILGDAAGTARRLTEMVTAAAHRPTRNLWTPTSSASEQDERAAVPGTVSPRQAIAALEAALPENRVLVIDAGHFGSYAQQGLSASAPDRYTFSHDFGAIGQAIGIGIGAAFALPGDRVTVVLGDGCFVMSLNELATCVRYSLDITFVVMNDGGYGQERHSLAAKGMDTGAAEHPWPSIATIAAGFGLNCMTVQSEHDLEHVAAWLDGVHGPALLDVRIDGSFRNRAFSDIAARLRRASAHQ